MADSNVEIYTLQVKRIVHALKNLDEGIEQTKDFKTEHNIDTALSVGANLPTGFVQADYADVEALQSEIQALILKYDVFQKKFEEFDGTNTLDPLQMLGKRFYMVGTTEKITRL